LLSWSDVRVILVGLIILPVHIRVCVTSVRPLPHPASIHGNQHLSDVVTDSSAGPTCLCPVFQDPLLCLVSIPPQAGRCPHPKHTSPISTPIGPYNTLVVAS
jgi:hypothetical protein